MLAIPTVLKQFTISVKSDEISHNTCIARSQFQRKPQ